MTSLRNFTTFIPLWTYLRVRAFLFQEGREVRAQFPSFLPYEKAFHRAYRFSNPFRISKSFLKQRGESNVHAYGETPLPVFAKIAKECDLGPNDRLIELGCGRGRGAIFLSHLTGCRVVGIDWVPKFVETANSLVESLHPPLPVSFKCQDMQQVNFNGATAIYLYGTCLDNEVIENLVHRFEKLPPSVQIITVSYPLSDYSPQFQVRKQFTVLFPWGEGDVYVNSRT